MARNHVAYCVTLNNPTQEDYANVRGLTQKLIHAIIGIEGLGSAKTTHLQMAFCYPSPTKWSEVKKALPRAHIESLKYDYSQAVNYCKKEGHFSEHGDIVRASQIVLDFVLIGKVAKAAIVGERKSGVSVTPLLSPRPSLPAFPIPDSDLLEQYEAHMAQKELDFWL